MCAKKEREEFEGWRPAKSKTSRQQPDPTRQNHSSGFVVARQPPRGGWVSPPPQPRLPLDPLPFFVFPASIRGRGRDSRPHGLPWTQQEPHDGKCYGPEKTQTFAESCGYADLGFTICGRGSRPRPGLDAAASTGANATVGRLTRDSLSSA
jgi:hypothetical protein